MALLILPCSPDGTVLAPFSGTIDGVRWMGDEYSSLSYGLDTTEPDDLTIQPDLGEWFALLADYP